MDQTAITCSHLDQIKEYVKPTSEGCEECLKEGRKWVALRMCLSCGHVGCCDSTMGQHARAHFKETGHAMMEALTVGPGQTKWRWCYIDNAYL